MFEPRLSADQQAKNLPLVLVRQVGVLDPGLDPALLGLEKMLAQDFGPAPRLEKQVAIPAGRRALPRCRRAIADRSARRGGLRISCWCERLCEFGDARTGALVAGLTVFVSDSTVQIRRSTN